MTIRLRAHHLLCLLTYAGKGYSPAFVANYDGIAERIARGEPVEIVSGPDDVCAPAMSEPESHCRGARVMKRDRLAAKAVGGLLSHPIAPGMLLQLSTMDVQALRSAFAAGQIRSACRACQWHSLCSGIAAAGYAGCRIPPIT
ncbi:DUF1284 domain-containing protein [Rhodoligotrophos defluvii]|uniref:DUF1284 domain-containing protein n=1 Tax=Rhodoligotrophos defluvii TaxID=2561934 RepID=UPI0010C97C93|nr:DUF1284 domain-containing protein [Rhodoligotrophos defluvii]